MRLAADARPSEKRLVYNTRPEGCQETGRLEAISRKSQNSNQFLSIARLTLSETRDLYCIRCGQDDSGVARAPRSSARRLVGAPCTLAQALQRSMYVSVVDRAARRSPTSAPPTSSSAKTRSRARSCSVAPATEPMQIVLLVDNSQAAEPFIRDYREALPAFITAMAADPSGRAAPDSLITLAERPTIITDYTDDRRCPQRRERIFSMPGSGTYLLDGIIETSQGITKRGSPAAGHRGDHDRRAGAERPRTTSRCSSRCSASGAALHVIVVGRPVNIDARPIGRARSWARATGRPLRQHPDQHGADGEAETGGRRADQPVPGDLRAARRR